MVEVICVIKLVLDPSQEAAKILDRQSRICNWLYNHLLAQANQLRDEYRETQNSAIAAILYTSRGLRDLIPAIKAENLFLKTVHSSLLKNRRCYFGWPVQRYFSNGAAVSYLRASKGLKSTTSENNNRRFSKVGSHLANNAMYTHF